MVMKVINIPLSLLLFFLALPCLADSVRISDTNVYDQGSFSVGDFFQVDTLQDNCDLSGEEFETLGSRRTRLSSRSLVELSTASSL